MLGGNHAGAAEAPIAGSRSAVCAICPAVSTVIGSEILGRELTLNEAYPSVMGLWRVRGFWRGPGPIPTSRPNIASRPPRCIPVRSSAFKPHPIGSEDP